MPGIRHSALDMEQRHTRLVRAAHEAIDALMAPYSDGDYVPGNIEDAVTALREGLGDDR